MIDLQEWLSKHNITIAWATEVAETVRARYPTLTKALKSHPDVEAELELIRLIHDVREERFCPAKMKNSAG